MSIMVKTMIQVLYIIICIAIVVVVLMQEGKNSGLGAVSGAADTYWSKNKGRSTEGKMVKITTVLGALFIILSLVLCANM
ncbi:MAG: preprotein translocase subunit SecG [Eubacterium sp.]|jgi:protein translocase, SecG subunit|nr:preprotein translocase subunit SecG [Eubacterium sp.]MCI9412683.1 preprotein translocase subunit SecG [Eubacterium sp.]MCI9538486.1 preprotein translocase subunit SecG [Eubacterium sp.]